MPHRPFSELPIRRFPPAILRRIALWRTFLPLLVAAYLFLRKGLPPESTVALAVAWASLLLGFVCLRVPKSAALFLQMLTILGDFASVVLAGYSTRSPEALFLAILLLPLAEMAFLLSPAITVLAALAAAALPIWLFREGGSVLAGATLVMAVPVCFFARLTSSFYRRLRSAETATGVLEASGLRLDLMELLRRWGSEMTAWVHGERIALFLCEGERWIRVFPERPKGLIPSYPEAALTRTLSQEDPLVVPPLHRSEPYSVLLPFSGRNSQRGVLTIWRHRGRRIWPGEIEQWRELAAEIGRSITILRREQKYREQAISQERARITAELHDGFLQSLLSVKLHAEVCSTLKTESAIRAELPRTRHLLHTVVNEVRQFLLELRPAPLKAEDFLPALRDYAEEFEHRNGIPVEIRVEGKEMFSDEQAEEVTGLVREALTNIRKHADARSVRITFVFSEDDAKISISDDGVGFDLKSTLERVSESEHHGLIGMRQRVETLRGEARFRSEAGKGTTLFFRIPRARMELPAERRYGQAT